MYAIVIMIGMFRLCMFVISRSYTYHYLGGPIEAPSWSLGTSNITTRVVVDNEEMLDRNFHYK